MLKYLSSRSSRRCFPCVANAALLGARPSDASGYSYPYGQADDTWRLLLCRATCGLATNTSLYLRNPNNGGEVFLVGTAHVSKQSAEEIRETIRAVRPDNVFVELCKQRADIMRRRAAGGSDTSGSFLGDIAGALGNHNMPLPNKLFKVAGSAWNRIFKSFGMEMGEEMMVAMEEADRLGARLILGDQPQNLTVNKLIQGLDMSKIIAMMTQSHARNPELEQMLQGAHSLEEAVEAIKNRRAARLMVQQMEQSFPEIARALIHERDEILARGLAQCSGRTVGVVGLAHLDGIEARWDGLVSPAGLPAASR